MEESYSEGVANHAGPESCGYSGNTVAEALTGERVGWVLSLEIFIKHPGCRPAPDEGKAKFHGPLERGPWGLGEVRDPTHARKHFARESGGPVSDSRNRDRVCVVNPKGVRP